MTRQIIFDTETTGLSPKDGHRIIEIGCVELVNRKLTGNNFHYYLNPERDIDEESIQVHGLTSSFLARKPLFRHIAKEFIDYIQGAELIAHNAKFDIGFLNYEFSLLKKYKTFADINIKNIKDYAAGIIDTLALAKKLHPGQRNSLDALCKRYQIDNSARNLHGALLDSEILAEVYLAMTGGQGSFDFDLSSQYNDFSQAKNSAIKLDNNIDSSQADKAQTINNLRVIKASIEELQQHNDYLSMINKQAEAGCLWLDSSNSEF